VRHAARTRHRSRCRADRRISGFVRPSLHSHVRGAEPTYPGGFPHVYTEPSTSSLGYAISATLTTTDGQVLTATTSEQVSESDPVITTADTGYAAYRLGSCGTVILKRS